MLKQVECQELVGKIIEKIHYTYSNQFIITTEESFTVMSPTTGYEGEAVVDNEFITSYDILDNSSDFIDAGVCTKDEIDKMLQIDRLERVKREKALLQRLKVKYEIEVKNKES